MKKYRVKWKFKVSAGLYKTETKYLLFKNNALKLYNKVLKTNPIYIVFDTFNKMSMNWETFEKYVKQTPKRER